MKRLKLFQVELNENRIALIVRLNSDSKTLKTKREQNKANLPVNTNMMANLNL
ncbi:hypothetical protein L8106_27886 [Lyngbya sp. PCC 8106]|nr:hypothetical protein L8106_27886 [Lyngbya sp. PCC 8106]